MTGWCLQGRHDKCAHREGGPAFGGITLPCCYVTIGDQVVATVIEPERLFRCSCGCHSSMPVGQLEFSGLFVECGVTTK
jgi:hypothetical protein